MIVYIRGAAFLGQGPQCTLFLVHSRAKDKVMI